MAEAKLGIVVEAKNQASGQLKTIKDDLQGINQFAGVAKAGLAGVFAAIAVDQIVALGKAVFDLGRSGAEIERLGTAFDGLAQQAGTSGREMLSALQSASQGAISNRDLMLAANRAMLLGVASSTSDMARLLEVASVRARAMGLSMAQAFDNIVTGIGRQSPLILDNLGITVDAARANEDYAASIGKTAAALSDQERKQALVNAVLAQSAQLVEQNRGQAGDLATSYERMDASLQNAKDALGQLFAPAVAAVAQQIADAATGVADALNPAGIAAAGDELAEYSARLGEIRDRISDLSRVRETLATQPALAPPEFQQFAPGDIDVQIRALQQQEQAYIGMVVAARNHYYALQGLTEVTVRTRDEQLAYNQSLWDGQAAWSAFQTAAQQAMAETLAQSDQIIARAQNSLIAIARQIADVQGADAGAAWLDGANAQLERQIGLWAENGKSVSTIVNFLLPEYLSNLEEIIAKALETYTATANIGKGAQQAEATAAGALRNIAARIDVVTARALVAAGSLARLGSAIDGIAGKQNRMLAAVRSEGIAQSSTRTDELAQATGRLSTQMEAFLDVGASGGAGGGGVAGLADDFSDLRSRIEQVISGATTLDFGLDPASFLPREDAINENARRLGAVMRDGIGNQEWMAEFAAEVPGVFEEIANSGDPRAAAARILQQFQAGMRPELLDRGLIKERVKAMILGDQNSAALAAEIAQELSGELGVSLAQAQQAVGSLLGTGGASAGLTGTAGQGLDGATQAEGFTNSWVAAMNAMVSRFYDTGASSGSQWGAGFLATVEGGVPAALVGILAALVTPAVMASLAANGSRTGAQ